MLSIGFPEDISIFLQQLLTYHIPQCHQILIYIIVNFSYYTYSELTLKICYF